MYGAATLSAAVTPDKQHTGPPVRLRLCQHYDGNLIELLTQKPTNISNGGRHAPVVRELLPVKNRKHRPAIHALKSNNNQYVC